MYVPSASEPEHMHFFVEEQQRSELIRRLRATRIAGDFNNDDWSYGIGGRWLSDTLTYWAEEFDWDSFQTAINALPNYRVTIDGVPIHFVWARSGRPDAVPIIVTHGWPWTFLDWRAAIPLLTDPARAGIASGLTFDVVVPSLPGFGFSSPISRPLGSPDVANIWHRLMTEILGYEQYGTVGGDWGGKVSIETAQLFPESVIGAYSTLQAVPGVTPPLATEGRFAPDEQWMVDRMRDTTDLVLAHLAVHRHGPQTLAYALNDSPAGLAAWIWERRIQWADPELREQVMDDRDFLCATASIYWLTGTIGTSMRFYRENFGERISPTSSPSRSTRVPVGYGITPRDILYTPRRELEEHTNLVHWSRLPRGGHFAAYEIPWELSADIHSFFETVRSAR